MKNLCLKNNYVEDSKKPETSSSENNKPATSSPETSKPEQKVKRQKHRVKKIAPHFISNITFDNYGNQDIYEKSKFRRRRRIPYLESTFKIAYDKEELEADYKRNNKPVSPTYVSHIFDNDEATVIKQRPINKNGIFYENICFDYDRKIEYKPPAVTSKKFISNIFNNNLPPEEYKPMRSPSNKYHVTKSNITFDDYSFPTDDDRKSVRSPYQMEDHINRLYDEPSMHNLSSIGRSYEHHAMDDHMTRIFAEPSLHNISYQPKYPVIDHMNKIFSEPSTHNLVRPFKPIPKNHTNYTTFNFDDPPEEAPPRSPPKDKFISHLFKAESNHSVAPPVKNNNLTNSNGIYAVLKPDQYPQNDPIKGIKTQYYIKDHVRDLFNRTNDPQDDDSQDYDSQDYDSQDYESQDYNSRDYTPRDYYPRDYDSKDYNPKDYDPQEYDIKSIDNIVNNVHHPQSQRV